MMNKTLLQLSLSTGSMVITGWGVLGSTEEELGRSPRREESLLNPETTVNCCGEKSRGGTWRRGRRQR